MADRYFVECPLEGTRARLAGSEAHHLIHVMRTRAGDEVVLFDGCGAEFLARVERIGRTDVELAIISRLAVDRELPLAITLGVALPKGDRRRWLVEKAVELGVARLVPLETARSTDREPRAVSARLRLAVIEASKQCGRNRLMEIAAAQDLPDFLAAGEGPRLMAHVAADSSGLLDAIGRADFSHGELAIAVGPEGGFTEAEVELARARGWCIVGLGARILRVETAALALAAAVMLRAQEATRPPGGKRPEAPDPAPGAAPHERPLPQE